MKRLLVLLAAIAAGCVGGSEGSVPSPPRGEDPGLTVWTAQGCGSCHTLAVAGSSTEIGPNLDQALPGVPADAIAAIVVNPPAGSQMPEDFGERMTDRELADLAAFLDAAVE